ncbi:hypothetical protein NM688_g8612 [Phlebia brevispora]|uniref:Uncharacterized protein n=1 Tax=Phlebia brevispora TaxID=194682 RepID=A0ACC1RT77_9APHY|nr:hypothetical protein NM688_g8612 [Phlebia brevispora]
MAPKTVPLILLSLAFFTPSSFSVPAPTPQDVNQNLDGDPTPTMSEAASDPEPPPSTVTAFFTPAVFLSDYYGQPQSAQDNAVVLMPEETPAPASTEVYDDLAPQEAPAMPSETMTMPAAPASGPAQTTPVPDVAQTLDATPTLDGGASFADSVAMLPTMLPTSTAADYAVTSFSSPVKPTLSATYSSRSFSPTSTSAVPLPPIQGHSSTSRLTDQSRKAALIGTILALACISGLVAFAFCMGFRLPRSLRFKGSSLEEGNEGGKDRDKMGSLKEKGKSSAQGRVPTPEIVVVPVLDSDAPQQSNRLSVGPPPLPADSRTQDQQQLQYAIITEEDDGPFEDVTRILSEETFQADVESMDSRDASSSGHRTSNGAASVTAESYATCESRYSNNSGRASQGSQVSQQQTENTSSFLSMSPPESPALQTPKQGEFPSSTNTSLPARAFLQGIPIPPGRYSDRMSASIFEDSDWDIAEAYGARYSKTSVLNDTGVVEVLTPISENMEAVEIGGRNCILVQGLAI